MKKSSEALKQESVMENMQAKETQMAGTQTDRESASKLHIQKVQPVQTTTIVSEPGGCRPTGT